MLVQEAAQHAEKAAGKFDPGETIIHHVANSPANDPLIHLPTIAGIDFSVTKHVLMLWLVAARVFVLVTWAVRRYLKQERLPAPGGLETAPGGVRVLGRRHPPPARSPERVDTRAP